VQASGPTLEGYQSLWTVGEGSKRNNISTSTKRRGHSHDYHSYSIVESRGGHSQECYTCRYIMAKGVIHPYAVDVVGVATVFPSGLQAHQIRPSMESHRINLKNSGTITGVCDNCTAILV